MCRVFKKRMAVVRQMGDYESPCNWYDDQLSFIPEIDDHSPGRRIPQPFTQYHHLHYPCKQELELQYNMSHIHHHDAFLQLPQLESPKVPQSTASVSCNSVVPYAYDRATLQSSTLTQEDQHSTQQGHQAQDLNSSLYSNNNNDQAVDQVTDWRVLDKFVASQLSHEDAFKENNYSNAAADHFHVDEQMNMQGNGSNTRVEIAQEYASTSTSSCQIDLWK